MKKLGLNGAMLFGRTHDRDLDDRANEPIFEVAAALRAPLYMHPQSPAPAVREAVYSDFGKEIEGVSATHGIGWQYEIGLQIVRLILAGMFDRHPAAGRHGTLVVFFYLDRLEGMARVAKRRGNAGSDGYVVGLARSKGDRATSSNAVMSFVVSDAIDIIKEALLYNVRLDWDDAPLRRLFERRLEMTCSLLWLSCSSFPRLLHCVHSAPETHHCEAQERSQNTGVSSTEKKRHHE